MKQPQPAVHLRRIDSLPAEYVSDFVASLDALGVTLTHDARAPRPQMAADWALPTLVAVYFARHFVDEFLRRGAKDVADATYPKLKRAVAALAKKAFVDEPLEALTLTAEQIAPNPTGVFSIEAESSAGYQWKFVFAAGAKESDEYERAVDAALDLLSRPMPARGFEPRTRLLCFFDSSIGEWKVIEELELARQEAQRQEDERRS